MGEDDLYTYAESRQSHFQARAKSIIKRPGVGVSAAGGRGAPGIGVGAIASEGACKAEPAVVAVPPKSSLLATSLQPKQPLFKPNVSNPSAHPAQKPPAAVPVPEDVHMDMNDMPDTQNIMLRTLSGHPNSFNNNSLTKALPSRRLSNSFQGSLSLSFEPPHTKHTPTKKKNTPTPNIPQDQKPKNNK